ncbi:NADP-dependent oxidoreductase [uncultured Paraglaciecola sp.]|uniref:NADP-dependent oxidoreductase n=1 Tax=uncultured Paraglaciecola sp. TaxID=1765024 RepID=UPI0026113EEB|nr:NADP-dependent oxidoreductase [uncultured Paraglaciecola sp.]
MQVTQVRTTGFHDGSTDHIFKTTHTALPALKPGEVKICTDWISIDPAMRGWTTNKPSYMPPVQPGEIMRCFGVAEVLESQSKHFAQGDWVTGFMGVQDYGVVSQNGLRKVDLNLAEAKDYLAGLGMTGFTGYFGMTDIGQPQAGETVVVSAASGAVGSIAAQVAKLAGARVIGIAGGPEKCAYLLDTLKLDGVIDYKNDHMPSALKRECPKGIDVYFDNVGGATLDAVLACINYQGRIVVCGAVSQYADFANVSGPANFMTVVTHSLKIQGFTMKDYMHRVPEAFSYLLKAKQTGDIIFREHIVAGLENFQSALEMIFTGKNHGKLLLKVEK